MEWVRQRLMGGRVPPRPPERAGPWQVECAEGGLSVRIFWHSVTTQQGQRPCWFYLSHGMEKHAQRELVFGLEALSEERPEAFPRDPLQLLAQIYQLAAQGHRVSPGDRTVLGQSQFLGRKDCSGLLYLPCPNIEGLELRQALCILPLMGGELEIMERHGPLRVTGHLGKSRKYFPFPPWFDRRRPALVTPLTLKPSLLNSVPTLSCWQARVAAHGDQVILQIPLEQLPRLAKAQSQLPADSPFTLLTGLDGLEDAYLVWSPGQKEPQAISPPGSSGQRLGGCFFLACPYEGVEEGKMLEDGFAFTLQESTFSRLVRCLTQGMDLELSLQGYSLALRWGRGVSPGPRSSVQLLDDDDYLQGAGFDPALISPLIAEIFLLLESAVPEHSPTQVDLVLELTPAGQIVLQVGSEPELDPSQLESLGQSILAMSAPGLAKTVRLRLTFQR